MSLLCFFSFDAKRLSFEKLNNLSNEIMHNALQNEYAAFFNDSFLDDIKIKEQLATTLLLSDSFLYRNADGLLDVSDYVYDKKKTFRNEFIKKYGFILQLINILFKHEINVIDFYVLSTGCTNYTHLQTKKDFLLKDLLNEFLKQVPETGFTFPDLKIQIEM